MQKIRKSVFGYAIALGLLAVASLYCYMFYFPWAGGYRVYTDERSGYEFAQANHLTNADKCPNSAQIPGFNVGCRAFVK